MSRPTPAASSPALQTRIGSVVLPNPVLTASGTAGHGSELSEYFDLSLLGAHVVKSLAPYEWAGNPSPRVHPVAAGMMNAVGLQGPGVTRWRLDDLPSLESAGVRVVASIWGRKVSEYAEAAALLAEAGPAVVAVEVNLSCPNLEGRSGIFAHDPSLCAEIIREVRASGRPCWAKLSPNTDRIVEVAGAVAEAGAEAVTLVNTVLAMAIETRTGRPALGNGGGGLSGPAIHPVAVRAVHDVRAAHRDLPIIGVGGVVDAVGAVELLMAGANAVQVGTATFADPRAPLHVLEGLREWVEREGVRHLDEIIGIVHRGGRA